MGFDMAAAAPSGAAGRGSINESFRYRLLGQVFLGATPHQGLVGNSVEAGSESPTDLADLPTVGSEFMRCLSFATPEIQAYAVDGGEHGVEEESIVVNLSSAAMPVKVAGVRAIDPWSSAILSGCSVAPPGLAVVLRVVTTRNLAGACRRNWQRLGDVIPAYPIETSFYISPHEKVGSIELESEQLKHLGLHSPRPRHFDILLNLWYAPADTDGGIHRIHDFLELHTQVLGQGNMQVFRSQDQATLLQDIPRAVGTTHRPLYTSDADGSFAYPWHRYLASSDCVWMAIEFHPVEAVRISLGEAPDRGDLEDGLTLLANLISQPSLGAKAVV